VLSTDQTVSFLRKVNSCIDRAQVTGLPDADPSDGSRVVISRWTDCSSAAPVVLYRIEGGGHRIPNPDAGVSVLDFVLGRMNHDFDAAEAIWGFFKGRKRTGRVLMSSMHPQLQDRAH
jgi:polyhydroxybutyrate depolymerase